MVWLALDDLVLCALLGPEFLSLQVWRLDDHQGRQHREEDNNGAGEEEYELVV